MRRAIGLSSKIARLEERTGINKPPEIPLQDCLHVITGSPEETKAEVKKRKKELVDKYGRCVLSKVGFLIVHLGRSIEGDVHEAGEEPNK